MAAKPINLLNAVAEAADLLYKTRQKRLELQKEVDLYCQTEAECRDFIIDNLPKSKANGITGRVAHVEIVTKTIPQVKDWAALWAYVVKHKAFEMLQRRVNEKAVIERWDANKNVPGVDKFNAVTLSLTKAKESRNGYTEGTTSQDNRNRQVGREDRPVRTASQGNNWEGNGQLRKPPRGHNQNQQAARPREQARRDRA